jgi:hypothetical protein
VLAIDELFPPVAQSAGWWVLGVALLVLATGLVGWALVPRRPGGRRPATDTAPTIDVAGVKRAALEHIAIAERRFRRGEVDERELHHELSAALRQFAAELGPTGARAMTPVELFEAGLPDLADVLHSYYPPRFQARAPGQPSAAVEAACAVVVQW